MGADLFNPVQIENAIRECAASIARGVKACDETLRKFLATDRAFDAAWAGAYLDATGNMEERKQQAVLATLKLRETRDEAYAANKYAERRSNAVEAELRAWQSVGASVRQAYQVAGRGEGA